MKINKFKLLSIAVCYLIVALWSGVQCMQPPIREDVPPGSIMSFAGEIAPDGWLMCDGKEYSNQEFPKLYEVIKEKYIPDGSWIINANKISKVEKYFCVPDIRGRVIVGVDNGAGRVTSNNMLGASGGAEKHQLTVAELPSHNHGLNFWNSGCNNSIQNDYSVNANQKGKTDNTGGDKPHNNMQPYQVLNYIINAGKNDEVQQLRREINELKISQQGCAKAWVNFDKNGQINNSYNVSSVIMNNGDGWGGDFIVNFSIPFSSTNYCCIGTAATSNYAILTVVQNPKVLTTSSTGFFTVNNLFLKTPPDFVNIVVFGE